MDLKAVAQIEIFISCKKLPNKDTFSKSDPFCVLDMKSSQSGEYKEIDRSETIQDNLSPNFAKMFLVDYFFEEHQVLRVRIFDSDSKSNDLSKQDTLGYVEFSLGELVAARGQTLQLPLLNKKGKPVSKQSFVIIKGEESSANKDILKMTLRGEKLDKKDFFGKSDPYLEFYRCGEDGSWTKTHSTEVVKNTLDPSWKEIQVPLQKIANGDKHRPIQIKCWDWDKDGSSDLIGQCEVTIADMMSSAQYRMELINEESKKKNKKYRNSGALIVSSIAIVNVPTFLDYIKGGCNVSLQVAIDFTGSNGDPNAPGTLHYRHAGGWNQYEQAIVTIGNILAPYDSDQKFPVWGFGGRVFGEVNHCFALTFDESNPEVRGVQGILDVYHNAFKNVTLSGPTLFTQIVQTSTTIADAPYSQDSQHYCILLILTDGVINDMAATVSAIQAASKTPMSIIIVGVGDADFSDMVKLDGDDDAAKSKFRDVVQFVPMNKFKSSHISMLAKETLAEVPSQFMGFMNLKGIKPNPPRPAAQFVEPVEIGTPSAASAGSSNWNTPVADAPPAFDEVSPDASAPPAFTASSSNPPAFGSF